MAKKFYVVWQGRTPGIYTDWDHCKKQIDKFTGARYKSFSTKAEAEQAFKGAKVVSSRAVATKKKPSTNKIKTYTAEEIANMAIEVKIFTDGGCEPNPGKAGSGLALYRKDKISELWYGLYNSMGTNNTAELNAFHQALIMAESEIAKNNSVVIFCDSKYSIQCITQWAIGWQKKGWKKPGGEIKNLEIIKIMFSLYQSIKNKVQVLHVNGHVGVEGNELADRMSILAIDLKNTDFVKYQKKIDLDKILSLRTG